MEENYYYLDAQTRVQGPYSLEALLQMHANGELRDDTLVAASGAAKWKRLCLLTPRVRNAGVGLCPKCGAELFLEEGEVPVECPACHRILHAADNSFMSALRSAGAQLFSCSGRATRAEFWWVVLLILILQFILGIANNIILITAPEVVDAPLLTPGVVYAIISSEVIPLVATILFFALVVRRMHDVGMSGWWVGVAYGATYLMKVPILVVIIMVMGMSGEEIKDMDLFNCISEFLYWLVLFLICFLVAGVSSMVVFVASLMDSQKGTNKYGPSVKYPVG